MACIFTGMLVKFGGLALVRPSASTVMGWLMAVVLVGVQTRSEEQHLLKLHGQRYRSYAATVGRFVPMIGRWKG